MASIGQAIAEHDVVELIEPVGEWPAGRVGAVVSDYGKVKLIEIADEWGQMLDLVQVPDSGLKLLSHHNN
jgi:hypothetical protein